MHLKVDTGMRRIGVEPEDALAAATRIASQNDTIDFVGVATHFATSDEIGSEFYAKQLNTFHDVVRSIRDNGIDVRYAHAANSGAVLQDPLESSFDMVRPGIMLYGYAPSKELHEQYRNELSPVMEFVSQIGFTKRITEGEGVSYNLRWYADRDTTIATVAAGYGDGYSRLLTGKAEAIVAGKPYPIRGTICMDQLMIETGDDTVRIGDDVTLISADRPELNAWEIASRLGTVPYEVLTSITARVPRIAR